MKNKNIKCTIILVVVILTSITVYADGWTSSQPSHNTLYTDTITSKTDASSVSIADSQGLFVTGTITTLGNVGIGTTGPQGKLDIAAGTAYPIRTSSSQRYIIEVKNSGDVSGGWWLANDVTGNFAIHENGIGDRLTIQDATGNVGIGTTGPGAKLEVYGGGAVQSTPSIGTRGAKNSFEWGHANGAGYGSTIGYYSSAGNPYIAFNGEAGSAANSFLPRGIRSSIILSDLSGGLQFGNTATASGEQYFSPLITMLNNGNVGIGTTGPTFSIGRGLHIQGIVGTPDSVIRLSEYSSGLGNFELRSTARGTSGNRLEIGEGSDTFLTIRSDDDGGSTTSRGNVGIGTTNPQSKLQVNGRIQHGGGFYTYAISGNSLLSTTFSHDVYTCGASQVVHVEAAITHWSAGYRATVDKIFYMDAYTGLSSDDLLDASTPQAGSWSFSRIVTGNNGYGDTSDRLRITHNAGSYAGGANYYIYIKSTCPIYEM